MEKKEKESALKVNEGIEPLPSVNEAAIERFKKKKKKKLGSRQYYDGIIKGDRSILSQAITLIESNLPEHQELAQEIIEKCLPHSGNSIRIGITGVPGVGKSSFIESIGNQITETGRKLAVLAIDPSSDRSKGSILGDKTRMEELTNNENAFIRPSPSAGSLGGVARKTRESVIVCEAAGYDTIFIETVGVGQSETAVHSMVDFFLLLMLAGAGDELQGIKRGIMEMADVIAITKADGGNISPSKRAKGEYQNALHLFPPTQSGWVPKVLICSAIKNQGIGEIWQSIMDYKDLVKENNYFQNRRNEQAKNWMHETIRESLGNHFYRDPKREKEIEFLETEILKGKISSYQAAKKLLDQYLH